MFGALKTASAVRAATSAATSLLRALDLDSGFPPRFWEDDYVLGYFGGTIGTIAKLASRGKLESKDLGRIIGATFANLLGSRGPEVWNNYVKASATMADDFRRGVLNANKVILVGYGSRDLDGDEDVIAARAAVAKRSTETNAPDGISSDASSVAALLSYRHFTREIQKRFVAG